MESGGEVEEGRNEAVELSEIVEYWSSGVVE
jgi:hypothetical protein